MANSQRGEVEIEAGGQTYTLRLGVNAIIEIQQELGVKDDDAFMSRLGTGLKLETLRTIGWKAIRTDTGEKITEETAGDIMDDVGLEAFSDKVSQAISLAWPDKAKDAPPPKTGKARASVGAPS